MADDVRYERGSAWTEHHRSIWAADKVAELRELWGGGLTAREIADRLGEQFSRAAVIGKANRLGLSQQKPGFTSTKNGRKKPVPRPAPPPPKPLPQPLPPERSGPPRMRRLKLFDLAEHHCRWPVGTPGRPDFFFCAADKADGQVYCETHLRVAFARTHQRG